MQLFVCGSNLFNQIESLDKNSSNTIIKTPQKLDINSKYGQYDEIKSSKHEISSATDNSEIDVYVCWDRIMVNKFIRTFENEQISSETFRVRHVSGNATVSCKVTTSGDLQILNHPLGENKAAASQEKTVRNTLCADCTEDNVVTVAADACKIVKEINTRTQKFGLITEISAPLPIKAVSCGKEHVLLLSTLGTVMSYGSGSRGQLGHGTTDLCSQPTVVEALNGLTVLNMAAGGWHSAAITDIGDLYMWGWNESGQLGFPCNSEESRHRSEAPNKDFVNILTTPSFLDVSSAGDTETELTIQKVVCGSRHSVCLTECGKVYCFGWNVHGQLGLGDTMLRDSPTQNKYFEANQSSRVIDLFAGVWTTVFVVGSDR